MAVPLGVFLLSTALSLKNAVHAPLVWNMWGYQTFLVLLFWVSAEIKDEQERVFTAIVWSSFFAGAYGASQYFGWDPVKWSTVWGGRPGSSFGNPNFAAGWWVMALPILAARTWTRTGKERILSGCATILCVLSLFWGRTHGAWIACGLSVLFGAGIIWGIRKQISVTRAVFVCLALSVAAGLSAAFFMTRIHSPSILERQFKWWTAIEMVKENPVFGVGAGNLKVNFALYQNKVRENPVFRDQMSFRATSESNVHNEFFQVWAETGTLGLLAFLSLFAAWFVYASRKMDNGSAASQIEQAGVMSAVIAFLAYSLTNFPMHIVPNGCLLFFLLGAGMPTETAQNKPASKKSAQVKPQTEHFARIAAGAVFAIVFFKVILPPFRGDYLRLQAEMLAAQRRYDAAIPVYEKSVAANFYDSERTAYDLAECYRAVNDIPNAIRAYEISARLRNYGEIYNNLGNCYYLLGNHGQAAQNWETALKLGIPGTEASEQAERNLAAVRRNLGGTK